MNSSEATCAQRMMQIDRGADPVTDGDDYYVEDVALRYGVTVDAVYRGIRKASPLYPRAKREGNGPKGWLAISPSEVAACDARRIKFYKTTPSWIKLDEDAPPDMKPPRRIAARVMFGN